MKALITGASGFVGTYMTKILMDHGTEVLGISRSISYLNGELSNKYSCDILDKDGLKGILKKYNPDYIVHLAGPAFIPNCLNQPEITYDTIVKGTLNLLEVMRSLELNARMLYVSSADVYGGRSEGILTEKEQVVPANPYSSAKACAELLCRQYYMSYGMDIIVARPFNHTGPGQSTDFVCSSFAYQVAQMRKRNTHELFTGNIDVQRDFLDVRDVVNAYMQLLQKGKSGEVYNVCSGSAIMIRDIIDILFRLARISNYQIILDQEKTRQNEIQIRFGDNNKIKSISNWSQRYSIEQTITDLYQYWKENLHVEA
ncbi:GDP-mannose 4,6-dehydratase [Cohnella hongkongensis]|uniref:GDP-mannose 4,6-dehydratase n=1 Tax=Cohnella hongkongensis TaxID=178337 RepID=A0ABV9FCM7_9BACL